MTTLTFDKLAYVDRLRQAGIDERHARAHADGLEQAFREEVVTKVEFKTGLDEVRAEIATLKSEVKSDIAELRSEVKSDIAELRSEVKSDLHILRAEAKSDTASLGSELKSRISALEVKVGRHDWMLSSVIGLCLLILGKLLLSH